MVTRPRSQIPSKTALGPALGAVNLRDLERATCLLDRALERLGADRSTLGLELAEYSEALAGDDVSLPSGSNPGADAGSPGEPVGLRLFALAASLVQRVLGNADVVSEGVGGGCAGVDREGGCLAGSE